MSASSVSAEIETAASGDAWAGSAASCFRRDWGRIKNNGAFGTCDNQLWTVGVRAITGARTFKATGCSGGNVSCAANVTDRGGTQIWWTGQVQLTGACGAGVPAATTLGSRNIASTEGVVFECVIDIDGAAAGQDWVGTLEY